MNIKQISRLSIVLFVLWWLLSGTISLQHPLVLGLGIVSILLVVYLSFRMKVMSHQGQPLYFPFVHFFIYWLWLMVEIFKSNIAVARHVIAPKMPIKPILKAIPSPPRTELGKVIYANSITLTPGTVAINITKDGNILVHGLHQGELDELENGEMGVRVAQLEPPMVAGMVCDISNTSDAEKGVE